MRSLSAAALDRRTREYRRVLEKNGYFIALTLAGDPRLIERMRAYLHQDITLGLLSDDETFARSAMMLKSRLTNLRNETMRDGER